MMVWPKFDVEASKTINSPPSSNVFVVKLPVRSILYFLGLIIIGLGAIFVIGSLGMACILKSCWSQGAPKSLAADANDQTNGIFSPSPAPFKSILITESPNPVINILKSINRHRNLPIQTTTAPALNNDITCKSVTAYFEGVFHNQYRWNKKQQVQLQFNVELVGDRIISAFYKWNDTYGRAKDTYINYNYDGDWQGWSRINQVDLRRISTSKYLEIRFNTDDTTSQWTIFWMPTFDGQLHLLNSTGKCTNKLPELPSDNAELQSHKPDPTLYNACWCCGDKYEPDPSLKCPKNPWV